MTPGSYFHVALSDITFAPGAHGKHVALGAIQVTRRQPGQSRSPAAWTPSDGCYVPTGSRATATASEVTWSLSLSRPSCPRHFRVGGNSGNSDVSTQTSCWSTVASSLNEAFMLRNSSESDRLSVTSFDLIVTFFFRYQN